MSELIIFDTSVLVDQLRSGLHEQRMSAVAGLVRMSSVVLSELWRGAGSVRERKVVAALQRNHPILAPSLNNWIESGQLLAQIRTSTGVQPKQLRDLHFDVLIALTARSYGARLITRNASDSQLIRRYRSFNLELW